jgi:multiple sugar transport system permease protein
VTLSTVLAIAMAVTLQKKFFGRSLLIAVLILPWALPGVVEGIVWGSIWDSNTGLLNSLLTSVHLIDHYAVFLGQNQFLTILAIELVQVWQITPLSTLLILAALQNIPNDVYEAANLDGSSSWSTFRRITLPLARPGITIAMVQAIIATLNVFDQPYVLNGSASTGASLTMETYFISFQNLNFGEGYALSLLITLATLVASFIVLKIVYRPVEY